MIVGIAIDSWKLTIFTRRLKAAGHAFTTHPGVTPDTLLLKVEVTSPDALQETVKTANQEAANARSGN